MSDVEPEDTAAGTEPERAERMHAEQDHPEQEAHGGSMAPGLVDATGHATGEVPPAE